MKKFILSLVAMLLLIQESVVAQFFPMPQPPPPPFKLKSNDCPINRMIALALITGKRLSNNEFMQTFKGQEDLMIELRYLALELELMDKREAPYIFKNEFMFVQDVQTVNDRFEAYKNAPSYHDSERFFQNTQIIGNMLAFNRQYRDDLQNRLQLDTIHQQEIEAAIIETNQLHQVWSKINDCVSKYYYITVRREVLQDLRTLIGDEAYYSGNLPPYVPIWRIPIGP